MEPFEISSEYKIFESSSFPGLFLLSKSDFFWLSYEDLGLDVNNLPTFAKHNGLEYRFLKKPRSITVFLELI